MAKLIHPQSQSRDTDKCSVGRGRSKTRKNSSSVTAGVTKEMIIIPITVCQGVLNTSICRNLHRNPIGKAIIVKSSNSPAAYSHASLLGRVEIAVLTHGTISILA